MPPKKSSVKAAAASGAVVTPTPKNATVTKLQSVRGDDEEANLKAAVPSKKKRAKAAPTNAKAKKDDEWTTDDGEEDDANLGERQLYRKAFGDLSDKWDGQSFPFTEAHRDAGYGSQLKAFTALIATHCPEQKAVMAKLCRVSEDTLGEWQNDLAKGKISMDHDDKKNDKRNRRR